MPIHSLPREIINSITEYLDLEDIVNLGDCLDFDVTKSTYERFFDDGFIYTNYDLELLKGRARSSLHMIGDKDKGIEMSSHFEAVPDPSGYGSHNRMFKLLEMESVGPIAKMCASEEWIYVLNREGKIFHTGLHIKENHTAFHKTPRQGCPLCRKEDIGWPAVRIKTETPHLYLDFSVEEDVMYAVTTEGNVMKLDDREYNNNYLKMNRDGGPRMYNRPGIFVLYTDEAMIEGKPLKVRGWSPFFEGSGIAVPTDYDLGLENVSVKARISVILPDTATGIRDWAVYKDCVLVLKEDGTVYHVMTPSQYETTPLEINPLEELNRLGGFVQMSHYGRRTALVTKTGQVVEGYAYLSRFQLLNKDNKAAATKGLEDIVCVSVGKTHSLAMTESGEVYSWGFETNLNGCLGLGKYERACERGAQFKDLVFHTGVGAGMDTWLELRTPTKLELPWRAFGISAGDSQTAILM